MTVPLDSGRFTLKQIDVLETILRGADSPSSAAG